MASNPSVVCARLGALASASIFYFVVARDMFPFDWGNGIVRIIVTAMVAALGAIAGALIGHEIQRLLARS
jgi:hypothetical protein